METRMQVAYHFKIDPAKLTLGAVRIPEQITRTVAVGEALISTEKVSADCLPAADRLALVAELEKLVAEATRTARPAGAAAAPAAVATEDEISAF